MPKRHRFSEIPQILEARSIPEPNSGCHLWLGHVTRKHLGYGRIRIEGKNYLAHHLAWFVKHGYFPVKPLQVLHKCDVSICVNAEHLFLGTQVDNIHDMHAKGRHVVNPQLGEEHHQCKLTANDIRSIRVDPRDNRTLAAIYNVTHSNISAIKLRKSWRHL